MYKGRQEEALEVLAIMAVDGDIFDAVVITQYHQVADTIAYEKSNAPSLNWLDAFKTPQNRKRIILACSCAIFWEHEWQWHHLVSPFLTPRKSLARD
jgi:hypothetical protein